MCVGVVGCCKCCPGGVLTAEGGPRHSWRRFPRASLAGGLALAPSVSLLPMVSHRDAGWGMLRVAVGEVALPVAPSVVPVVRSLRALLWFTVSLMLLMLLVVGVGLCVGCQWLLLVLVVVLGVGRWVARLERLGCNLAAEGGRVVMCTPDWGCSGEHAYWRPMLDRMTVGRVQLPTVPSMCLRTQTQLCRPLSGPVSYPSLMDLPILYPCVT